MSLFSPQIFTEFCGFANENNFMKRLYPLPKKKIAIFFVILSISLLSLSAFSQKKQDKKTQPTSSTQPSPTNHPLSAREIANKVLPSTVMIITQDENGKIVAQGSGFVYKPGLIATNLHVFNRATQAFVKFVGNDVVYKVEEVVGLNPRRDLCVVRISDTQTKPLSISSLTKNEIGDDVFVASNPKGLEGSFSKGIISAIRKNAGLIQIDAAISPGSSGGAVLNNRGEVVGMVVSSVITGQNLNFAISIEYLMSLKLEFKEPVTTAGALAFNQRQREKLKGFVESFIQTKADMEYKPNTDSFVEQSAVLNEEMFFDINGNLISEANYHEGRLIRKTEYSYDDEGVLRRITSENDLTPLGGTKKWKSDKEFTVFERIKVAKEDQRFSQTSNDGIVKGIYDNQGNVLEITIYAPNSEREMNKTIYAYGKYGFVSEEKSYEFGNLSNVTRFTYEVDELGNWIKRVSTIMFSKYPDLGFIPNTITYRKITYF
ncbi:hypothetical protein BH10ACI1_BH10ACI1_25870 [soil metagenome]